MFRNNEAYALNLFEKAYEAKIVEEVREEIKAVKAVLRKEPRIFQVLNNPRMSNEEKKDIINQAFKDEISDVLMNFLFTLLDEDAFNVLNEIEQLYSQGVRGYLEDYLGIVEGDVYSVIPLTEDQMQKLVDTFSQKLGKQVRFTSIIDTSLIGGYRVSIKDKVYDDSIKFQLGQLKETLIKSDL